MALLRHERRRRPAALAEVHQNIEPDECDGLVVITAAADQRLIDIHDRKPSVLTSELAREWIAPSTSPQRAAAIVEQGCTSAEDFRWYQVGKAVGNVRNEGESLIAPINNANHQGQLEFR